MMVVGTVRDNSKLGSMIPDELGRSLDLMQGVGRKAVLTGRLFSEGVSEPVCPPHDRRDRPALGISQPADRLNRLVRGHPAYALDGKLEVVVKDTPDHCPSAPQRSVMACCVLWRQQERIDDTFAVGHYEREASILIRHEIESPQLSPCSIPDPTRWHAVAVGDKRTIHPNDSNAKSNPPKIPLSFIEQRAVYEPGRIKITSIVRGTHQPLECSALWSARNTDLQSEQTTGDEKLSSSGLKRRLDEIGSARWLLPSVRRPYGWTDVAM